MSRGQRMFIWGFLFAFLASGFLRIEAWPFTAWRLFSTVRHPVQSGWEAVTVDGAGVEQPLRLDGAAWKGTTQILEELPFMTPARREMTCSAWIVESGRNGRQVNEIRIYRVVRDLHERRGPFLSRSLSATCGSGSRGDVAP